MKKTLLLLFFLLGVAVNSTAQIKTCCYFDNFWSNWQKAPSLRVKGDFDNFVVYNEEDGPWNYFLRVKINDFTVPTKKQRKKDLKKNKKEKNSVVYEYYGTVEYFLPDDPVHNPTLYGLFQQTKALSFWPQNQEDTSGMPPKKVVSNAKIFIFPYKDYPSVYDIKFDNIAAGFYLDKNYFPNSNFEFNK